MYLGLSGSFLGLFFRRCRGQNFGGGDVTAGFGVAGASRHFERAAV